MNTIKHGTMLENIQTGIVYEAGGFEARFTKEQPKGNTIKKD